MCMWEKKLYIKQPFPDNYTDSASFLKQLEKNTHVKLYSFSELVLGACHVQQHWSSVFLFLSLFSHIYHGSFSPQSLQILNNALLSIIYIFWMLHVRMSRMSAQRKHAKKQVAKAAILLLMTIFGLSPVLKTLTEDISSDTIGTLTGLLLLINLIFHNYGEESNESPNPIALNAALFAAVMLASRLDAKLKVFGLISLAIIWFSLFPIARSFLNRQFYPYLLIFCTLVISACTAFSLYRVTLGLLTTGYMFLTLFILFICPGWYKYLQKYKNNIHGPWDEAKLQLMM